MVVASCWPAGAGFFLGLAPGIFQSIWRESKIMLAMMLHRLTSIARSTRALIGSRFMQRRPCREHEDGSGPK